MSDSESTQPPKTLDAVELATSVAAAAASAAAEAAAEAAQAAVANAAQDGQDKMGTRLDQFADDDSMSGGGGDQAGPQHSVPSSNASPSGEVSSVVVAASTTNPSHAFEDTPPSRVVHIRRLPTYVAVPTLQREINKIFEATGLRVECVKILEQKKQALAQLECVEDATLALQYFNEHPPYVRDTRVFINFSRNPQIDKPTEPGQQNWEVALANAQGISPSVMHRYSQPVPMAPTFGGDAMELITISRTYMQQYNPYGALVPLNINEREADKFRKLR